MPKPDTPAPISTPQEAQDKPAEPEANSVDAPREIEEPASAREQHDSPAPAPTAKESDDPPKSEAKPVDTPREIEEQPSADAKDIPVDSRAEYDHSLEEPNIAVSDISAESNVTDHAETKVGVDDQPAGAENLVEEHDSGEVKEISADPAAKIDHGPQSDEGIGANAVSMPVSNSMDTTEAEPDVQEPYPKVQRPEAQDGDESGKLKPESHPTADDRADDAGPVPGDVSTSGDKPQTEIGDVLSGNTSIPMEEPSTETKGESVEAENKPHDISTASPEETGSSVPGVLPSTSADVDAAGNAASTETHSAPEILENQLTQHEEVAEKLEPSEPISREGSAKASLKDNLEPSSGPPVGRRAGEEAALDENLVADHTEQENIEPTVEEKVEEPSEHPVDHASSEPPQTIETSQVKDVPALDKKTSSAPGEVERTIPEEHILERAASPPLEDHASTDGLPDHQEEVHKTDTTADTKPSVPVEESQAEDAAVAWWEKGDQAGTQAQRVPSESGWVSRSPAKIENGSIAETPPSQSSNVEPFGTHAQDPPDEILAHDEHAGSGDHPDVKVQEVSETLLPTASAESIEETSELGTSEPRDIEDQGQHTEQMISAMDVIPKVDEEGPAPAPTKPSNQDQPEASDKLERAHASEHEAPGANGEQETASTDICSPPLDTIESGHEESPQAGVEGREMEPVSNAVEELEVEQDNAVQEQGDESGEFQPALSHHNEQSTSDDHSISESAGGEQEPSVSSDFQVSQPFARESESADTPDTGQDEQLKEPEDLEQDILDEYASNDLNLREESHPVHRQEHGIEESPQQEPGAAEHERPVTPTQTSNIAYFAPSTPQHLIHQENYDAFAESPATVLDADDLFEDDDEEEDGEQQVGDHGHGEESLQHATSNAPEQDNTEGEQAQEETSYDASETRAFFASLGHTIRPKISLLRQLASQSSASGNHESEDAHSVSEYSQATPGEYYTPGLLEDEAPFPPQDLDAALHIRTHTADTIPSFESYAQSDDASTPTSPSEAASSPFLEDPHDEPNIRSSWQDNSALQGSDPTEAQELKPQASPLQGEFDPYNTQTYPNYISPKTSQVNLRTDRSSRDSFSYSGSVDPPRFSTESSISTPPPVAAKSPRLSSLNTLQASQYSEGRQHDSPVSATRSHHSSEHDPTSPTTSHIPRRPTDRTLAAARTPVSSPSIPSNSFFQKTRSLFESASQSPSPPASTRPLSSLFAVNKSSPSRPRRNPTRPTSLLLSSPGQDEIIPRSLDKDGRPPSPVFTLPGARKTSEGEAARSYRNSNPFLDGLSKLVGSGGLEDSMHNPNRRMSAREKEPLLKSPGSMDGY